jgi:diguanylate cyclase (GGDEF)-like protein
MRDIGSGLGLQSLAAMAHVLMRPLALDELIEVAADQAREALGAATVSISQVESDSDVIRTLINVGDLGPGEERYPREETYSTTDYAGVSAALHRGITWVASLDDPGCAPSERELLTRLGKGSSLATAIVADGKLWGEFYATRHVGERCFDAEAVAYAEVLAAMVAAAVARAEREAMLARLAFCDPLTGLANRRALDDRAAEVFDAPAGTPRTVTMIAVDINNLKQINDAHGHARGDVVIKAVAETLSDVFDSFDNHIVARVGGDEFMIMVTDQDSDEVVEATNEACRRVSTAGECIGISTGVAAARVGSRPTLHASVLFAAADRAQYAAKRSGSPTAVISDEFAA